MKISKLILVSIIIILPIVIKYSSMTFATSAQSDRQVPNSLLSDPFLQLPTENTVNVVWFTEFKGDRHMVKYGLQLEQTVAATTTKLTRMREDADSKIDNPPAEPTVRDIWRHEATVPNLTPNLRLPYQVESSYRGKVITSDVFTLASNPTNNTPVKILLTSDHQLMPMTAANLAKVVETVDRVDGVFLAGDLVNIPDRASEWFDDRRGGAFFPSLQGKANYELVKNGVATQYPGGEVIQHAPLFTALGNHEVMGSVTQPSLKQEFNQPLPREVAKRFYQQIASTVNPSNNLQIKQDWIENHSFNTNTYEEIFSLPQNNLGNKRYYAVTFGNIRLISLYVTNIWRSPSLAAEDSGRYKESSNHLENLQSWACGDQAIDQETGYPELSKCRIYKPIWQIILDWLKNIFFRK